MTATATPTLAATADTLAAAFEARAQETEAAGTMPADLVEQARSGGLLTMATPAELGGLEVEPSTFVSTIETLARADAASAWSVLIGNGAGFLAWMDPCAAREMIGDRPVPVTAATFAPNGRLTQGHAGAYELNGRWSFLSGCRHSELFLQGAFVTDGDGAPRMVPGRGPDWRLAAVPADQVTIIGNWDVAGLRGTGSDDVTVTGASVPNEYTFSPFFEPARAEGPLWRFPFFTFVGMIFAGFPLGVGRRALDELTVLAGTKQRAGSDGPMCHDGDLQMALARAEGSLRSARAFVFDTLGELWSTACHGDVPDVRQRAQFLLANQQAMHAALGVVDVAFAFGGASSLYLSHPLQRCFRDLHAASQHIYFSPGASKRYAQTQLGLDVQTFMF